MSDENAVTKDESKKPMSAKEANQHEAIKKLTEENLIFKNLLWATAHARDGVLVVYKKHVELSQSQDSYLFLGAIDDPNIIKVISKVKQKDQEESSAASCDMPAQI